MFRAARNFVGQHFRLKSLQIDASQWTRSFCYDPPVAMDNERIATCVLEAFEALPARCKPVEATAGVFQWVPLSGIVIMKGNNEARCVALGYGNH